MPVSRGVAIGRAVLVASSRVDVAHYFIDATAVEAEIDRLRQRARHRGRGAERAAARPAGRSAGRAVGAARRAPDAAARRDAHRCHQGTGSPTGTTTPSGRCRRSWKCWRGSSTRWRTTTCASARPTWSRWSNACCARMSRDRPRRRMRRTPATLAARLRRRRPAGAGGQRRGAGRHDAVQAQRLHRLRHRRRRAHLAHRDRGAQHGHSGGGRRARGQPPDPPGRLGRHRRRCRRRDRRSVAHRAGGVPLPAAPERARARPAATACATRRPSRWTARRWSCWPTSNCPATRPARWRPAPWAWACSAASSCS